MNVWINLHSDLQTLVQKDSSGLHRQLGVGWSKWLERELTDRMVRGSNPTYACQLLLSRIGQPDSSSQPSRFLRAAWQIYTEKMLHLKIRSKTAVSAHLARIVLEMSRKTDDLDVSATSNLATKASTSEHFAFVIENFPAFVSECRAACVEVRVLFLQTLGETPLRDQVDQQQNTTRKTPRKCSLWQTELTVHSSMIEQKIRID
ncbi:hypothetical protein CSKR_107984 [Clonorchis sinensis]|uniref:Uncharacterized protein n=1 Tax=Clonorchis sinensis TaxID=79923 RepID=A0A3R7DKR0_CLOSI|nr:hypothetical protein CSKR_107984 [Clonorchis sinensis]